MSGIEKRAARRRVVNRNVRLRWSVAEMPAIVRNSSADGAMLIVNAALAPGAKATILSDAREIPVTVMWSRDGYVGVQFDR